MSSSTELEHLPDYFIAVSDHRIGTRYVDCKNFISMNYRYVIENHFLKDSVLEVKYDDDTIAIRSFGILDFIRAVKELGIDISKFKEQLNEHLKKLETHDWNEFDKEWYDDVGLHGKTADDIISGEW